VVTVLQTKGSGQTSPNVAKPADKPVATQAVNCHYCGEELPHCRCYWKHQIQKEEAKQEQLAFQAGMDAEMRGDRA
jgi:hypothetical protein